MADGSPLDDAECIGELQDAATRLAECGALDEARRLAWRAAQLMAGDEGGPGGQPAH